MSIKELSELIKLNPLFRNITPEEIEQLFSSDNYRIDKYTKNSIIYFQNEKCSSLDMLLSGTVVVQSINKDGNVLTISEFAKGDIIGLNLLFSQKCNYPMTIISKSDSIILHMKKEIIIELSMRKKDFLLMVLQYLSDRSVLLTDKIKLISGKSIRQLILDFLTYEYHIQGNSKIKLIKTKKELAEKFGIQRTSLSRELQKMREEGMIDYDRDHIFIKDVAILSK